jgi:hypothetical protein
VVEIDVQRSMNGGAEAPPFREPLLEAEEPVPLAEGRFRKCLEKSIVSCLLGFICIPPPAERLQLAV